MELSQQCTEGGEDDTEEPILGAFESSDGEYSEDGVDGRPNPDDSSDSVAYAYIAALKTSSGLHLTDEEGIKRAYENHGELGLFSVFITQEFKASLRLWTNGALAKRGLAKATVVEFDAYLGLELAMSICPQNDISDFWSERRFLGQRDFMEIMGRTRFQTIRDCIKIHPQGGLVQ
ncbi:hypothetical protein PF003_g40640 [Phytophthora fragariae]|nr:hypothetical protein PF003_g40640 [Phytophthora fragariae]